jgi:two-component system chemotaxis response regulator CheB
VTKPQSDGNDETELKVVALVGSAGALRAFTEVLAPLPEGLEASIVVIMHLQRDHESVLASILSRKTAMPVLQAAADDVLEPGHVYVAPPDAHLLVAGGKLELDLGPPIHFLRPSADVLLASLAGAFGARALAVVLSGSGSDGADGVVAIKKAGGTVLAQGDAEYSGMPRAAMASGAVDRELPLPEISGAIVDFVRAEGR